MNRPSNKNIIIIVLALLMLGLIYTTISYRNKYKSEVTSRTTLINGISDSLIVERNKNGSLTARISTIETSNKDMVLELNSKDESIVQLQNIIKRESGYNKKLENALAVQTSLAIKYKDSLGVNSTVGSITIGDTTYETYKKHFVLYNPYDNSDTTQWIVGDVLLGKMLFELQMSLYNKYDVVVVRERKNIFSKWVLYTDITTYNPYDKVNKVRSYSKQKMKPKRFGIGPSIGVGYSMEGFTPYIGIGLNYNLLEF